MTGLLELSADEPALPVRERRGNAGRGSRGSGRAHGRSRRAARRVHDALPRARPSEARACEQAYRRGEPQGPLAGLPLGVKDLFDSAGVRTTYGSPMCADHVPEADAEALRRARAAGAILVGKTQTHELAWGITSVNDVHGHEPQPVGARPHLGRLERRIGGGARDAPGARSRSAATPAARSACPRHSAAPSASSRPTGESALAGIWPLARTLDHPGPMARTPADAALLLGVIAGWDPADPATARRRRSATSTRALARGLGGPRRRRLPRPAPGAARARRRSAAFDAAVRADIGARRRASRRCALPEAATSTPTFGATQRAEALHTHSEAGLYPERAAEYGADVRGRLETAAREDIRDYLRAAAERAAHACRVRPGSSRKSS